MTRRITRAKQAVRDSGARFSLPTGDAYRHGLGVVLHVLYLIFNEGYATTAGENLQRSDLTAEAIRLTRMLHRILPDDDEVTGLLALMLLTDARRPARTDRARRPGPDGRAGPQQVERRRHPRGHRPAHRRRWPTTTRGPTRCRPRSPPLHDEAGDRRRDRLGPDPGTVRAAAAGVGQPGRRAQPRGRGRDGRRAGRRSRLPRRTRRRSPARRRSRLYAVLAHLLELAGDRERARVSYLDAARGAPASRSSATCTPAPHGWRSRRPTPPLLLPATICHIVTSD